MAGEPVRSPRVPEEPDPQGVQVLRLRTTLQLEPGITCIVGPNGSGKSNVVDALAWVMGEQGAKSLRGGKMEDVIFAGTAGRPPLGRAEVALTIDNSDGALPIDYSEVTISRTMFRNGGSEYAINGQSCRLLDVQELLSDSGIGREMHVIVGQGQLDSILRATPEERRGFIEEAAGVLKHRKRKEKALRKLESTEGNLTRLGDLLSEIRRQLKPLGRQAEVARKAAVIQADVRDARARLLADELVTVRQRHGAGARRRDAAPGPATRGGRGGRRAGARAPRPRWRRRCARTSRRCPGRRRPGSGCRRCATGSRAPPPWPPSGSATPPPSRSRRPGATPTSWRPRPSEVRAQEQEITGRGRSATAPPWRRRWPRGRPRRTPTARRSAGSRRMQRAAADRREGLARLQGQVNAKKSRVAAAQDELGRLEVARAEAAARAERAERDFTALETRIAGLDAGEEGLDAEHEVAAAALEDIESTLAKMREEAQAAERERAALVARREALELGLSRKDGSGALLAATEPVSGLLGSVAALVEVRSGYEAAVAAALGRGRRRGGGRRPRPRARRPRPAQERRPRAGRHGPGRRRSRRPRRLALAARRARRTPSTRCHCPEQIRGALQRLLDRVAVVDDAGQARSVVRAPPRAGRA